MSYLQPNPRSDSTNSFFLNQSAATDSRIGTRIEETSHACGETSKQPIFQSVYYSSVGSSHNFHRPASALNGVNHIWFGVAEGRVPAVEGAHTRMTILKRVAHCQGLRVAPSIPPPPPHHFLLISSHWCGVTSPLCATQTVISFLSFTPTLKRNWQERKIASNFW